MANVILTGGKSLAIQYIEKYISENGLQEYEIDRYDAIIKVEDARRINKSLAVTVKGRRLIVIMGEMTIESQNALLKCIEEVQKNVDFLLYSGSEENFLSTIRSRCKIIALGIDDTPDEKVREAIRGTYRSKSRWDHLEYLASYADANGFSNFQVVLQEELFGNMKDLALLSYYYSCSKLLLAMSLLSARNNVNSKIVTERIFSSFEA